MIKFIEYEHHGKMVSVREDLKGKHREHCLCYKCKWFKPKDIEKNCPIANKLYEFNCQYGVTTPVWECKTFVVKEGE